MIIKLSEIINGIEKTFDYIEYAMESIDTLEGVRIKGEIYKEGEKYIVKGTYKATLKLECVRCLVEIEPLVEGEFKGEYLDSKTYAKYISSLKPEEEFDSEYLEEARDDEINISNLVREYIILDLSEYATCIPECENTTDIDRYSEEEMDPRWQQLLDIKN